MKKVIISLAPIAAGTPVHAETLAMDVKKSVLAGAAMCHLHCRKENGELTPDITYMQECFECILSKTDVLVQASTGGVSNMNIKERCNPLNYSRVESSSLNGGTTNLGDSVYINSYNDIRYCAKISYEKRIIPEVEVFDIGMIHTVEAISKEIPFRFPILYNLVFGHKGGMQASIDSLNAFRSFIPPTANWGVTHYGRDNWHFLAAAIAMGASVVRIGFEDSSYLNKEKHASFNYELVEKLAALIRSMDFAPATPNEARRIMGVPQKLFQRY